MVKNNFEQDVERKLKEQQKIKSKKVNIKDETIKIYAWLKDISLEESEKVLKQNLNYKFISVSSIIDQDLDIFAEQIYDKKNGSRFCCYSFKEKTITYKRYIQLRETFYYPIKGEEVTKGVIKLPSKPLDYNSDDTLDVEIKTFIKKWLDIPDEFRHFSLLNIKRSWVFERFHTLNYLRARGDFGTGKSRFLDTLGSLHYKPISTSGATTAAPIFRIIDQWKGSLIMDEADFQKSDEAQDIIKIINQGYEKGKFVMRCDQNDAKKIQFFDPFCPKVLATRKSFYDKATESRCTTHIMTTTSRKDIPLNLNQSFEKETLELRNKLLMWRFKNYFLVSDDIPEWVDWGDLEPRVKQIASSYVGLFNNDKQRFQRFKGFLLKHQGDIIEERRQTFDGQIVGAIKSLIENGQTEFNTSDIVNVGDFRDKKGNRLNPKSISSNLKSLGFAATESKKINGITKRIIPYEKNFIKSLFKKYGYDGNASYGSYAGNGEQEGIKKDIDSLNNNNNEGLSNYRNFRNSVTYNNTELVENISKIISQNDTGRGLKFETLRAISGWNYDDLARTLETASKKGEITQIKNDVWKVLE